MSSRRKIESPDELLRQSMDTGSGGQQAPIERKSVFERLGTFKSRRLQPSVAHNAMDESLDLRYRMSRKRRNHEDASPTNQTPLSPPPPSSTHRSKSSAKSDDKSDAKVKSLVLAPNRRSESPTLAAQSVSSSTSRRSTHRSGKYDDEDSDSEELEKKRLELQKQLQDLDCKSSGSVAVVDTEPKNSHNNNKSSATNPLSAVNKVARNRSRSSSLISSESGSYSSSLKSLAKTESSENSDKKAAKSSGDKKVDKKSSNDSKSKSSDSKSRTHVVSSSISVKSVTHAEDSSSGARPSKGSEPKFDRHGNLRISLDEQERQKRLRAERFGANKPKASDSSTKKSSHGSHHLTEPKIVVSRDDSCSPPTKKSKDTPSERHSATDSSKTDHKRDRNSSSSLHVSKYEPSGSRSRSRDRKDTSRQEDNRSKSSTSSSRNFLDTNATTLRDRSRESHYSDRDNVSSGGKRADRRRGGNYSREQSPTHSSHSKLSRDRESSIGSDFSRRSKSERLSNKSIDANVPNKSRNELKTVETKANDSTIEDRLSSISADSSIPDVPEVDLAHNESKGRQTNKRVNSLSPNSRRQSTGKSDDESADNFSDWSEGEDELLLKTDGFETLDEVCNISDNSLGKDSWNGKSRHSSHSNELKSRRESHRSDRDRDRDRESSSAHNNNKDDALEAISDDELDAIIGDSDPSAVDTSVDAKTSSSSRQVLDALDIDWGSLVTEPKAKLEFIPGSARKRFSAANVLMRIGFSQAYAGQHMTQKLIDFCQSELKEEFVPFRHPMAAVHSILGERIKERLNLFGSDTTPATVLSGRKELQIRKMLNKSNCKLSDNCLTTSAMTAAATTTTTPQSTATSTTTPPVNELSVSSTNPIGSHVSDIECF